MARVFVFPGEIESHWFQQWKRSETEETDFVANIVRILFDFGSSQASSSVIFGHRAIFLYIDVFSEILRILNYFVKRCSPRPKRLDFGLVLDARTSVEFFEAEAIHLVYEQDYSIRRFFGVTKSLITTILKRPIWIFDLRNGKEFLPGLDDVGLRLQHRFLIARFTHDQYQLQFGFWDQAFSNLIHRRELVAVLFFLPGGSEPVSFLPVVIAKSTPFSQCCDEWAWTESFRIIRARANVRSATKHQVIEFWVLWLAGEKLVTVFEVDCPDSKQD